MVNIKLLIMIDNYIGYNREYLFKARYAVYKSS